MSASPAPTQADGFVELAGLDSELKSGGGDGGVKALHSAVGKGATSGLAAKASLASTTSREAAPHASQRRSAASTAADASYVCRKSSVRYSSVGQCVGTCVSATL